MQFLPETYFDLHKFPFADIFKDITNIWDVLPRIKQYAGGTLIMGKNCSIHPNANIREGVILGDNVHIGYSVELKNCMVMSNTAVAHLNYIGDGVIGNDVNVAGGAILANLRLDKKPVRIKSDNKIIDTHLEKFSCIIGDHSSLGANCVLNPGTILGKNSVVYPLTSVQGVYPNSSIVR